MNDIITRVISSARAQDLDIFERNWSLCHTFSNYLHDPADSYMRAIFSCNTQYPLVTYVSGSIAKDILTPGKPTLLALDTRARDPVFYANLDVPAIMYTAILLLKFMKFSENNSMSMVLTNLDSNIIQNVMGIPAPCATFNTVSPEITLKGVKVLCAIAALKPEVFNLVKNVYERVDKDILENVIVYAREMFNLHISTGKVLIRLPRANDSAVLTRCKCDDLRMFCEDIRRLGMGILNTLGSSLEDFVAVLETLDIDEITTYKEENTMLVVTEILKNLVNKGVLISRDGRLLSITISADDTINVEPFRNGENAERPLIANLVLDNNGQVEEIVTLKDAKIESIVNHAQSILNGPVVASVNGVTMRRGPVPQDVAVAQATVAQAATAQAAVAQAATILAGPTMRRNADGSISTATHVNGITMWRPATQEEVANFRDDAVEEATTMDTPVIDNDPEIENEQDLPARDNPNDIVVCSVAENIDGQFRIRMIRTTREEANNNNYAILQTVEWRD